MPNPIDSTFVRTGPDTHIGWLPVQVARADNALDSVAASAVSVRSGELLVIAASVESEDRAGDLVIARGWELESYLRNPVVLWAHQHCLPPIARSVEIAVEGDSLMATIEFADTPFAQEIKHLYLTGFMNGVSVGFRALEVESRKAVSGRRGTVFKRQELLEISAAPVPLHPLTLADRPAERQVEHSGAALELLRELAGLWKDLGQLGSSHMRQAPRVRGEMEARKRK